MLGLGTRKSDNRMLLKLSKPRPTWKNKRKGDPWFGTLEEYEQVIEYCKQDVRVERAILDNTPALSPRERHLWVFDLKMNAGGIPIDLELAERARTITEDKRDAASTELSVLTDGAVTSPSQVAKIRAWLSTQNVDLPDLQKPTLTEALNALCMPAPARRVIEIRQNDGGVATAKYNAFCNRAVRGRVFGEMIYYGAHTGRWTSNGVQLHNAVKNRMNVDAAEALIPAVLDGTVTTRDNLEDVLTTLVRSVIRADENRVFVDIDFNAIEARVLAWMTRAEDLLTSFRENDDPYVRMAARIYGIPTEMVTSKQRALGKVAILGLGYGMGEDRFYDTCIEWGVEITRDLASRTVTLYRDTYPMVVRFWHDFERAVRRAFHRGESRFWRLGIFYDRARKLLSIYLPNGRPLIYHRAEIKEGRIQYFGRLKNGGYGTVDTWGGKLTENVDQAIARDALALAMLRVDALDECVRVHMTVHDEILASVPADNAAQWFEEIKRAASTPAVWMTDLPLGVDGWIGKRFRKD